MTSLKILRKEFILVGAADVDCHTTEATEYPDVSSDVCPGAYVSARFQTDSGILLTRIKLHPTKGGSFYMFSRFEGTVLKINAQGSYKTAGAP